MTRISNPEDVRCCICKVNNKVRYVCSSSTFSGPDLDTRPGFMTRYNIKYEVYSCQNCGYCNIDLDNKIHNAKTVIQMPEYKKRLKNKKYPKKANEFSCLSMIYESNQEFVKSGWQYLKAAWICDDLNLQLIGTEKIKAEEQNIKPITTPQMRAAAKAAMTFRKNAFEKFMFAEKKNKPIMKTRGETRLLQIDLLRRIRQFDVAQNICLMGLKKRLNGRIRHILHYELHLCRNSDDTCHNIDAAMEYKIKG